MNSLKDTLNYILSSILPDTDIKLEQNQVNNTTILEITAPSDSIGKIIGKNGRIIKSIRTILGVAHPNTQFRLDIIDQTDPESDKT